MTLRDGRFVEVLDKPSTPLLARRLDDLGLDLPEGYRGEVNLGIGLWMAEVANALKRGFVLTIDYGYEARDLYSPDRARGTVQTYYRHTTGSSPYQHVGMQDITAHVDFSLVVSEGEAVGLRPVMMCSQADFLNGLGLDRWMSRLRVGRGGEIASLAQRELHANLMAMRELVNTDGLGGFKVLLQEKGAGITDPRHVGRFVGQPDELTVCIDDLPIPLRRSDHVPLTEGRYPHTTWDPGELWPWGEGLGPYQRDSPSHTSRPC